MPAVRFGSNRLRARSWLAWAERIPSLPSRAARLYFRPRSMASAKDSEMGLPAAWPVGTPPNNGSRDWTVPKEPVAWACTRQDQTRREHRAEIMILPIFIVSHFLSLLPHPRGRDRARPAPRTPGGK